MVISASQGNVRLQVWLWKLIADPDIARSRMLNNFLELTDAARMVTKCAAIASRGDVHATQLHVEIANHIAAAGKTLRPSWKTSHLNSNAW